MSVFDPIYEILAKEVVYGYDNPESEALVNLFLATAGYEIDQEFDDPATGFQAIGLISTTPEKPPVLVIRGTNELVDDAANSDPRGVGFNQFKANRQAIADWLTATAQETGKKPDVIGHSMAGGVAQITAAKLTDLVGDIVTFNSPGSSQAIANQFLQRGGANKNVTHYVVSGDFVSLGGEAFIAGKVILQSYNDPTIDPTLVLKKHREINRLLTTPPPGYSQTEISITDLNSPTFGYSNDTDYLEFLAAYNFIRPTVASAITTRAGTEALRLSPGFSFLTLALGAPIELAPDQANYLLGDDLDNTANAGKGADIIFGKGGADTLNAGSGRDQVSGGSGNDTLRGDGGADLLGGGQGNDLLIGGSGNDRLVGGIGLDTLIGVDEDVAAPGRGELDVLLGKDNTDLFVLGNEAVAFYNDGDDNRGGKVDYALIEDFQEGDVIQLRGAATDYSLKAFAQGATGTGIYLKTSNKDELIGVVQGVSELNLTSGAFAYVT